MNNAADIQSWIDSYTFVDNSTASRDVLYHIVRNLPDHQFKYGPNQTGGYVLEIAGPTVTANFVLRSAV